MRRLHSRQYLSYIVVSVALATAATIPAPVLASSTERVDSTAAVRSTDHVLRLELIPDSDGTAHAERHISKDLMAYRFRIESSLPGAWSLSVFVGGAKRTTLHLTSDAPEITLPRPLGLMLPASDTLFVLATLDGADNTEAVVTLYIEHEPADRAGARLPVLPLHAESRPASGDSVSTWSFTAEVSGRVLALSGLPTKGVRAMALVDAASGAAIWSTTVTQGAAGTYCLVMPRLGAVIEAGRTYRVRVVFSEMAPALPQVSGVVAMVLPAAAR